MEETILCPWCSRHEVSVVYSWDGSTVPVVTSMAKSLPPMHCYYAEHGVTPYGNAAHRAAQRIQQKLIPPKS